MVLAGGCVVGVLYKAGGGSLPAGLAILGLLAGSAVYAEIHPYWSRLAQASAWPGPAVTLPQLTGVAPGWWVAMVALCGGWFCWQWQRRGLWRPPAAARRGVSAVVGDRAGAGRSRPAVGVWGPACRWG